MIPPRATRPARSPSGERRAADGRHALPGGPGYSRDHNALAQELLSITGRLFVLPDATLVLPGHGDGTTIGASRAEHAIFAARAPRTTCMATCSGLRPDGATPARLRIDDSAGSGLSV
ncbi:MAG: hypothetical protein U0360_07740 [Dehalococcoidia bacterium]